MPDIGRSMVTAAIKKARVTKAERQKERETGTKRWAVYHFY